MPFTYKATLSTPDFDGDEDFVIDEAFATKRELVRFERGMIRFLAKLNELSEEECEHGNKPAMGQVNPQNTEFRFAITQDGHFFSGGELQWVLGDTERSFMRGGLEGLCAERKVKAKFVKRVRRV